jgi:hypothetical protein
LSRLILKAVLLSHDSHKCIYRMIGSGLTKGVG